MRLLTLAFMRNNSADAKGKGYPLRVSAQEINVEERASAIDGREMAFVKGVLPTLDWSAVTQIAQVSVW